ncbi:MAG: DedA family protein [Arachnia propionica]|uniref:DedA family protein n=1 Tax=Arachnia propionica TaxID=1750 RepID=UPI00270D20E1|nr:DedA family protein [Arachnia propionica]
MSDEQEPRGEDTEATEWWQDEGMPWKQKPGRADIACMTWFGLVAVYGLVMLPLRAWLIVHAPDVLAMISGSRTAIATVGALSSQGAMPHALIVFAVAAVASIKLDWIFWWAGRLWGRGMIEVWAGRSARAAKSYAVAERWAHKLGPFGFLIAYVPIPLPIMQVVFVLSGATGLKLWKFLLYDFLASTVWLGLYYNLGWMFGEPIVQALEYYAKIAGYISIALLIFVVFSVSRRQGRKG